MYHLPYAIIALAIIRQPVGTATITIESFCHGEQWLIRYHSSAGELVGWTETE